MTKLKRGSLSCSDASNMSLVGPPAHMADIELDSLTDSVSGLLKSTLDHLAPYEVRIKKLDNQL